jgi:hypothetical protein
MNGSGRFLTVEETEQLQRFICEAMKPEIARRQVLENRKEDE